MKNYFLLQENFQTIAIEERRGVIQKLIKLLGDILMQLFRWLKPHRQ